jgi:DNA polymerase-4
MGRDRLLPPRTRRILHVDVDAFLASVEIAMHPELFGKPVVIGGSPGSRNIVMSSSYAARAFGVRPGIHLAEAERRCPDAIFRKGNSGQANELRAKLTRLLLSYTPHVAVTSVDDFLVDLTDSALLHGDAAGTAEQIHLAARKELRLPLSIGVGTNPLLARLAGKIAKPGRVAELLPGLEDAWLRCLPVNALPGVGHSIGRHLARFSIGTVGDLRTVSRELLFASFGRPGLVLFERCRGVDDSAVEASHWIDGNGELASRPPKSIRRESTFEPEEARFDLVEAMLAYLVERAASKLRGHGQVARSVEVTLRYVDTRTPKQIESSPIPAKTLRKQRKLPRPTDGTLVLVEHARSILAELPRRRALVKRVGVALNGLATGGGWQTSLYNDNAADEAHEARNDRHRRIDSAMDTLREKMGFGLVLRGSSIPLIETHPLDEDGFELRTPSLNQ